jgi:hypothetical protein
MNYVGMHELVDPHRYVFEAGPCKMCNRTETVEVLGSSLWKYDQGAHVQDAFPSLSDADREFLFLSGICGECFDKLFPDDEDE